MPEWIWESVKPLHEEVEEITPTIAETTEAPPEGTLMSTQNDYSADEWEAISAAPAAAGLAITLFDVGGSGKDAEDMETVARTVTRALVDAPEIVRVVAELLSGSSRPALRALPAGDRVHTREALIATVRRAVHAIETKSPAEAEAFKAWLASVAAKACHATSPGRGQTQVGRDLQDTIDRLAEVLAVTILSTRRKRGPFPSEKSLARNIS